MSMNHPRSIFFMAYYTNLGPPQKGVIGSSSIKALELATGFYILLPISLFSCLILSSHLFFADLRVWLPWSKAGRSTTPCVRSGRGCLQMSSNGKCQPKFGHFGRVRGGKNRKHQVHFGERSNIKHAEAKLISSGEENIFPDSATMESSIALSSLPRGNYQLLFVCRSTYAQSLPIFLRGYSSKFWKPIPF